MFGACHLSHPAQMQDTLLSHVSPFTSASQKSLHDVGPPADTVTLTRAKKFTCVLTQPGDAQKALLANISMSAIKEAMKGSTR